MLSPWGTGMNLAVGPTFNKYGYPHMAATAATDHALRWPSAGRTRSGCSAPRRMGANALVEVLTKLKDAGKINNKSRWSRSPTPSASSCRPPPGRRWRRPASSSSTTRAIRSPPRTSRRSSPRRRPTDADTFVAFSYPPDTFGLTGAAIAGGYNPKVFYTAVGTAFPIYKDKFRRQCRRRDGHRRRQPGRPRSSRTTASATSR